jgi:Ca2+-binding RTX toxin-like protein
VVLGLQLLEPRNLLAVSAGGVWTESSSVGLWRPIEAETAGVGLPALVASDKAEVFALDDSLLDHALAKPLARAASGSVGLASEAGRELSLPMPTGELARFRIEEVQVMAPELAAKFPSIRTYAGQGVDDPAARLRIDVSPRGFHGQVLSPSGAFYIDPYELSDRTGYVSYFRSDMASVVDDIWAARPGGHPPGCLCGDCLGAISVPSNGLPGDKTSQQSLDFIMPEAGLPLKREAAAGSEPLQANQQASSSSPLVASREPVGDNAIAGRSGTQLRTYRLAVAATGEYTAYHGGTVASAQAAIVTAVNRVTGIYESELSIRLQLVPNNDLLVFTNAATDPYTNSDGGAMLGQNQTRIDSVIGSANYDIGHVFSTGGGGIAGLGVVGIAGSKAQGVTGSGAPVNDSFWVDYVAHEIGHQFGGNHTFNGDSSSCAGGNRNAATAYEPGSGSTIQAYAGICGNDDLQSNSDPYFHSVSFDEIIAHVDQVIPSVGTRTTTGNTVPQVDAGASYVIPAQTPFELTATGFDADGDTLTYSWEQRDLGPTQDLAAADNGSSPIFRVWNPTTSPTRTFPRLSNLLANTLAPGEKLPTTNRTLNFRVTARDNRSGGGGVNTDDTQVQVVATGTPFRVTAPNTAVSWTGGSSRTFTWDVAGTSANGINAAEVLIQASVDGGLTYPYTLARTANDGSHAAVLRNLPASTTARIRIQPVNNIFFDVSNANFTVTGTPDIWGPTVLGHTWRTNAAGNPVGVRLQFDEPMQASSFSVADDVTRFDGPNGSLKDQITASNWVNSTTLDLDFTPQTTAGRYQLVLASSLNDVSATQLAMDQNGDGTSGQVSDGYSATYDKPLQQVQSLYTADMSTNPGWTFSPGVGTSVWAYGTPTGAGGTTQADGFGSPDPTSGVTGSKVIGFNLSGNYANSLTATQWATTPAIDASSVSQVSLSFYRWLGVEESPYDRAYIEVSGNNGTSWSSIWANSTEVADSSWALQTFDVSSVAAGKSQVRFRWGLGPTDSGWRYAGWNLDDVTVTAIVSNYLPYVDSVSGSPDTVTAGDAVQLTASGVVDPDGTVARVDFYRDANANGVIDVGTDVVVGQDTNGTDGWGVSLSTSSLSAGGYTMLARATDDRGYAGNTAATTLTVQGSSTPLDIVMQSLVAGGGQTLQLTYEVTGADVGPFVVAFYRAAGATSSAADTLLDTITLSASEDLTVGVHIKTLSIGGGVDEVALPGAGAATSLGEYYLLAVADPSNVRAETDADPILEDNVARLRGIYHPAGGGIFVHGTDGDDSITVSPGSVRVQWNATDYTYADADVTSLQVFGYAGVDAISNAGVAKALWAHAGDGNDTVIGGSLADTILGGAGNDVLRGDSGNDSIQGQDGDDDLEGGTGVNTVEGGTGTNELLVTGTAAIDTISLVGNAILSTTGTATLNGDATSYSGIQQIQVDTLGGPDVVTRAASVTIPVHVSGLAPTVTATRSGLVVSGSFTDVGDDQTWTGTIDVGDGNGPQVLVLNADRTFTYALPVSPASAPIVSIVDNESNTGTATVVELPQVDIQMTSATANGQSTLTVSYTILNGPATPFDLAVYASPDLVVGGDTLVATLNVANAADLATGPHTKTWTIGANAGQVALPGAGIDDLAGDYYLLFAADPTDAVAEDDGFAVSEDNTAVFAGVYFGGAGPVMVQGRDVADSLVVNGSLSVSFNSTASTYTASKVTRIAARMHGGNDTVNASAYNKPVLAWGGADNDTITSGTAADALSGGPGNDLLTAGNGADRYLYAADVPQGSDTLNESAGGVDVLDFSETLSTDVTVNLAQATAQVVNGNLTLALGSGTTFEAVVGGGGNDTLTGNSLANRLVGNGGNDALAGGTGNDAYEFDADSNLGTDTLTELTSGGTDVLSFATTTLQQVTVDLGTAVLQVVNANLSLVLSAGNVFENAVGGDLDDAITGSSLANLLQGGPGADSLQGAGGNDSLNGNAGDDTIAGGDGNDTYVFDADLDLGTDTLVESATGGTDLLDFALTTTKAVQINLGSTSSQTVVASLLNLMLGDATTFEQVRGGSLGDTLVGSAVANTLTGGPGDDTLQGLDGNDVYGFDADGVLGTDSIVETSTGGIDTLDFALTTTRSVNVNLSQAASQNVALNGATVNLALVLGDGAVMENAIGGSLADSLTGNSLANRLLGGPGSDTLAGGAGDDTYVLSTTSALTTETLVESVGNGVDLLDFSALSTAITVDLSLAASQTVITGVLAVVLGNGAVFESVAGTSRVDTLRGNSLDNVLVGGAGNDTLIGQGGRDLLFGGSGADSVQGGADEDIIVSGLFAYFNEATRVLDRTSIDSLRTEWTRGDVDYPTRIANLRNGAGLNGASVLNATTVTTDGTAVDSLFGNDALDWFWRFGSDTVGDLNLGGTETVN